jgi:hypothetical protein
MSNYEKEGTPLWLFVVGLTAIVIAVIIIHH